VQRLACEGVVSLGSHDGTAEVRQAVVTEVPWHDRCCSCCCNAVFQGNAASYPLKSLTCGHHQHSSMPAECVQQVAVYIARACWLCRCCTHAA
jgi:hypothetical protein